MANNPNRLLVVDDELQICELVADVGEEIGYEVRTASRADEFFEAYRSLEPTVILLDLNMPGTDGVQLLQSLAEKNSQAEILLMSGVDSRTLASAERLGKVHGLKMLGNLNKPMRIPVLEEILRQGFKVDQRVTQEDLRQAIESRQLTVHYQPKILITGSREGRCEGVEALVRWDHPGNGLTFPDEFIPLAEQTGLIVPLTDFVLGEVARQTKSWMDAGLDLTAAVNLPASLLEDAAILDRVAVFLRRHEVPNDRLYVEVTESGAMANTETTIATLTRFRIKGIGLSIDDFGTGYSSLVQLHRMPFSELKVDKSFVIECAHNTEARTIVEVIVALGCKLGLSVCAEGVETLDTWEYLHALGCHKAQGYYMSKPIPAAEIKDFATNWTLEDAVQRSRSGSG